MRERLTRLAHHHVAGEVGETALVHEGVELRADRPLDARPPQLWGLKRVLHRIRRKSIRDLNGARGHRRKKNFLFHECSIPSRGPSVKRERGTGDLWYTLFAMKIELTVFAAALALAAGAFEWDFTNGLPEGGRPRACAVLGPDGLSPSQIAKNVTGKDGAGVMFPQVTLPEEFTFEAEVVPFIAWTNEADRAAAAGSRSMHVFDTMAVNYKPKCRNMGMQVMFHQSGERWTAVLYAGLGDMTCRATGPSFTPKAGVPVRLRFEYDALGTVRWDLDGQKQESYLAKAGPIVPDPKHRPVVGDRICSLYWPFNGYIRRIAVTPLACPPLALRPDGRRAFERGEANATFRVAAFVREPEGLRDVSAVLEQRDPADGRVWARAERRLDTLPGNAWTPLNLPLETRLRTGPYSIAVRFAGRAPNGKAVAVTNTFDVAIGPVFADRMPAVMWGSSGTDEVVRDFGFTHVLRYGGLTSPECTREQARQLTDMYDRALAAGMRTMHSLGVRYPDGDVEKFYRCRRDGTAPANAREQKQAEVSNPELVDYARRIVAAETARVGDHPAFAGVLPCSELRDHTSPSFRTEHLRYKAETGRDVPPGALPGRRGADGRPDLRLLQLVLGRRRRLAGLHGGDRGRVPQDGRPLRRRERRAEEASVLQLLGSRGAVSAQVGLRRRRGRAQPVGVRAARADERGRSGGGNPRDGGGASRPAPDDHDAAHLLPRPSRAVKRCRLAAARTRCRRRCGR